MVLDLALAIGLITAWLYTVGWSYAKHYFEYFHVGLLALEVPTEYFLMYSFWVLRDHLALFIVLSLLAVGLAVARGPLGRMPPGARRGLIALLPVLVLGLFWGGYRLGEATARTHFLSDREADFPAHPRVRVWVDPGAGPTRPRSRPSPANSPRAAIGCWLRAARRCSCSARTRRSRRPTSRWSRCRPPPSRPCVSSRATRAVGWTRRHPADPAGATTTSMRLPTSILCIALFAGPIEAAETNAAALARWQQFNQQVTDA